MHRLPERRNHYIFESYSSVDAVICEIRRGNGVNVVRVYYATRTSVFKRLILRETHGYLDKRAETWPCHRFRTKAKGRETRVKRLHVGICKYILRKDPLRRLLCSIVSLSSVLNKNFETFARSSLLLSAFSVRLNDHGDRLAAALGADRSNRWHCEPQLVPKCVAAGT